MATELQVRPAAGRGRVADRGPAPDAQGRRQGDRDRVTDRQSQPATDGRHRGRCRLFRVSVPAVPSSDSPRRVRCPASPRAGRPAIMLAVLACSSGERPRPPVGALAHPASRSPAPAPPSPTRSTPSGSTPTPRQTGVQINYQSIGSGGGIRQFTEGTVDFGATDGPMTDEQIAAVHGNVLHVPTVLGAVVADLQPPRARPASRSGSTARRWPTIFLGQITRWNDRGSPRSTPASRLPAAGHHRGAPVGRVGHDATSSPTTSPRSPRSGRPRSATPPRSNGRSAWAARATRA